MKKFEGQSNQSPQKFTKKRKLSPKIIKVLSSEEIERDKKQAEFFSKFKKAEQDIFIIYNQDLTKVLAKLKIVKGQSNSNLQPNQMEEAILQMEIDLDSLTWKSILFISKAKEFQLMNYFSYNEDENLENNDFLMKFKNTKVIVVQERLSQLQLSSGLNPKFYLMLSFVTSDLKYLKHSEYALYQLEPDNPILNMMTNEVLEHNSKSNNAVAQVYGKNFSERVCLQCIKIEDYKEELRKLHYLLKQEKDKNANLESEAVIRASQEDERIRTSLEEVKKRSELINRASYQHFDIKFRELSQKFEEMELQRSKLIDEVKRLKSSKSASLLIAPTQAKISKPAQVITNEAILTINAHKPIIVFNINEVNVPYEIDLEDDTNKCKMCYIENMMASKFPCNHSFYCERCFNKTIEHCIRHLQKTTLCPICRKSEYSITKRFIK